MTAPTTITAIILVLVSLALLIPVEARPHDHQGEALSLIRMVGSNVREARRNLRLAASMQKELLQAVRGLGQGGRALQRRVRESVLEEEVKKPVGPVRKRRPFAPWAGK